MTFPSELKGQETKEVELMVRSSFSDPGSFFGLMSMCAAHRAALAVDRFDASNSTIQVDRTASDPDYCIMKAKSIREMNAKVRDPKQALSDEAFDTIVNLLTGSVSLLVNRSLPFPDIFQLIAGLFDEARIHLTGLKRMVDLRGGIMHESIRSASMLAAIITYVRSSRLFSLSTQLNHSRTDVKAASGLLVKPVFPLTWDAQPVPQEVQQRLRPSPSAPSHRLGSGFFVNTLLSPQLIRILWVVRDIIYYGVTVRATPAALQPDDNHLFRVLNCEAEHQLLSYIYSENQGVMKPSKPDLLIHPIEEVARVASICFLNHFLIVSPPSSGLGRALTKHLIKAVNDCKMSQLLSLSKENFGLLAWALFVGAQGSRDHAERPWFVERLARVAMICEWQTWEQASNVLSDYFYVSAMHGFAWRSIWDEAMTGFVISTDDT